MKRKKTIDYITNNKLSIIKKGWKGNIMIDNEFHNVATQEKPPLWNVIKWKLSRNPQREEKNSDRFKLPSFPI